MIQSLKKFVSMAIQGTQVPMYTNTHCFCIFMIFQIFLNFVSFVDYMSISYMPMHVCLKEKDAKKN